MVSKIENKNKLMIIFWYKKKYKNIVLFKLGEENLCIIENKGKLIEYVN